MRLIQYKSVLTFKLQIEFVPFKIVPLGGYTLRRRCSHSS